MQDSGEHTCQPREPNLGLLELRKINFCYESQTVCGFLVMAALAQSFHNPQKSPDETFLVI